MPDLGSISILIDELRQGDEDAIREIWTRYFEPLSLFAKSKIPARNRRIVDSEDIASSAIDAFQNAVRAGKYPSLKNREHIWKFLVTIAGRNSIDRVRRENAEKRGSGNCRGESVFNDLGDSRGLERFEQGRASVEALVDLVDQLDNLLSRLSDEDLKNVLLARLAGNSIEEIAEKVGKSVSSVERKLKIVRKIWLADNSN